MPFWIGVAPTAVASKPAVNAARLAWMPFPPRLIALSNAWRGNGSTPAPAVAPNSTALMTLPVASAIAAMSKACITFAAVPHASISLSGSTRPSAIAIFSVIANTRLVEAISVVRSGVISPRLIAGPASISSDDDIDIARHRHQRQHRLVRRIDDSGARIDFEIVDRRAGALRDTRHGGELREIVIALGKIDDPVGEHATAFATHREDRDGDRTLALREGRVHGQAAAYWRRAIRRCRKPITAPRAFALKRSHPLGLLTMEAR